MTTYTIRVHYPPGRGQLGLRTELDWTADVPAEPTADGARFTVETDAPWLYFKPCLRDGDQLRWTPGLDRIADGTAAERHIYPWFFDGLAGRLTELHHVDGVRFRAYLPAGYDENPLKRYPVLYMHDGANLFLPEEAFLGRSWNVDETLDLLHQLAVIDQVIVIAVYAGNRNAAYTSPGYVAFADACANSVRPWVDAHLRTLTGPRHTAVLGSSLGGVLALHTALAWPETFGMAACLSSTFGVFDDLFERVGEGPRPPLRLYLDSGWPRDNFERTIAMRDRLLLAGYRANADLLHLTFPGARHDEPSWRQRLHIPFQWFFGKAPTAS
ncbi:MAG TPA: alpha/beta hydrolase-fold protein [Myxococcota bacterium]|nr:alpha/beta hydrolase-fold protein [Myxococcota bacterium]